MEQTVEQKLKALYELQNIQQKLIRSVRYVANYQWKLQILRMTF